MKTTNQLVRPLLITDNTAAHHPITSLPTIMPSKKVTEPPKQSGTRGSGAQRPGCPQEEDNSGEEFGFGGDDEGSEDLEPQTQTKKTSTTKNSGVADIVMLFKVMENIGKKVCIPCG
jgi:hypothetical protein